MQVSANKASERISDWRRTIAARGDSQTEVFRPRKRAFTLIELVMVVLVISILTSVAVTRISTQLQGHSVDSAAVLFQTDLKAAQQEAIATSSSVTVTVNQLPHTYTIAATRNGAATIVRSVNLSSAPWNCSIVSLLSGAARTPVSTVALSINGAGMFGGDLEISLISGSASGIVKVEANSGRVLIE